MQLQPLDNGPFAKLAALWNRVEAHRQTGEVAEGQSETRLPDGYWRFHSGRAAKNATKIAARQPWGVTLDELMRLTRSAIEMLASGDRLYVGSVEAPETHPSDVVWFESDPENRGNMDNEAPRTRDEAVGAAVSALVDSNRMLASMVERGQSAVLNAIDARMDVTVNAVQLLGEADKALQSKQIFADAVQALGPSFMQALPGVLTAVAAAYGAQVNDATAQKAAAAEAKSAALEKELARMQADYSAIIEEWQKERERMVLQSVAPSLKTV